MAAVIALRPKDDRGQEVLDEFEARFNIQPMQVIDDGTRRYHLDAKEAEVDATHPATDQMTEQTENTGTPVWKIVLIVLIVVFIVFLLLVFLVQVLIQPAVLLTPPAL